MFPHIIGAMPSANEAYSLRAAANLAMQKNGNPASAAEKSCIHQYPLFDFG